MAISETAAQKLIRAQIEMRRARHEMDQALIQSAVTGVQGYNPNAFSGMQGPKGVCGEPGPPGRDRYTLTYCGIHFLVELLPSTFDMIEDATNVNGDELAFIKVINEDEWKRIRGAWAHKWQQNKAFEAFEMGDPCNGEDWLQ
jgi:hypothetical protein